MRLASKAMKLADDIVAYYLNQFDSYREAFSAALKEAWRLVKLKESLKEGTVSVTFVKKGETEPTTRTITRKQDLLPKSKSTRKAPKADWYYINAFEVAHEQPNKWCRFDIRNVTNFTNV